MNNQEYSPLNSVVDIGSGVVNRMITMGGYTHLYKYRSLGDDVSIGHTKDIILNNRLYWPSASELNDPFECRPKIIWEILPQDRDIFFQAFMRDAMFAHIDEAVRHVSVFNHINNTAELAAAKLGERFEQERSQNAVLSFSASFSQKLLWSHYADAHRGVCLQFTPVLQSDLSHGMPVHYTDQRPIHNAFMPGRPFSYLLDFFLTKHADWQYEKEYRIVKPHKLGLIDFEKGELTGIILGSQITERNKEMVTSWCANLDNPPQIYQAVLDPSSFEVTVPDF